MPSRLSACLVLVMAATGFAADDTPPLRQRLQLDGFPDNVTSLAISPDGTMLAAGSYDVVKLFELPDAKPTADLKTRCGFANALTFSADGRVLYVGGYQQIQTWEATSGKKTATWRGHRGYVRDFSWNPDQTQLASASEDQTIRIWDAASGDLLQTFENFEYPVLGVAWSPDGKSLASVEGDETRLTKPGLVKLHSVSAGEVTTTFPNHDMAATAVAFSVDGAQLLTTSLDEHVNVYDVSSGAALGFFGGHSRPTNCVLPLTSDVAASGSGGRFKDKNEIKLFNPHDGEEYATGGDHAGKVTALVVTPDRKTLFSASYDRTVRGWDLSDVPALQETEADPPITVTLAADDAQEAARDDVAPAGTREFRVGLIGLDTSHATAFTRLLNAESPPEELRGARVVVAYPQGSADIKSSTSRIPRYTEDVRGMGVEIVDSVEAVVAQSDVVLLETNDGRPHLEQALPVLKAKKPVFIDKPLAGSLVDCIAIMLAAEHYGTPIYSASSLRYIKQADQVRSGEFGKVTGCSTWSPCSLEPTHPDLFWYGIHGVEALYTVMGPGCETVTRASTDDFDFVTGVWSNGTIGTFRGIRRGASGYGGTAFTEKKVVPLGPYAGYQPLVVDIVRMFRTGQPPVDAEETLEIYVFMEAADESKRRGGVPVSLAEVRTLAEAAAREKLATLIEGYAKSSDN